MREKPVKPLGRPAYGSIPHILKSRLGPGDHTIDPGQSMMCTDQPKKGWTIWVQTKYDGTCVSAACLESGEIVALGRAGYPARSSGYEMHHLWADWVEANDERFRIILKPGERAVGEWLAQAHGTKYELGYREPFVLFDIMTEAERMTYANMMLRNRYVFMMPDTFIGPAEPTWAMAQLDHYGAEEPEGIMYRAEQATKNGPKVQFLAKWVQPNKVDGKYLENSGHEPVWNWRPQ